MSRSIQARIIILLVALLIMNGCHAVRACNDVIQGARALIRENGNGTSTVTGPGGNQVTAPTSTVQSPTEGKKAAQKVADQNKDRICEQHCPNGGNCVPLVTKYEVAADGKSAKIEYKCTCPDCGESSIVQPNSLCDHNQPGPQSAIPKAVLFSAYINRLNLNIDLSILGDANGDHIVDILDVHAIASYLSGGERLGCPFAADVNRDGLIDGMDAEQIYSGEFPFEKISACDPSQGALVDPELASSSSDKDPAAEE